MPIGCLCRNKTFRGGRRTHFGVSRKSAISTRPSRPIRRATTSRRARRLKSADWHSIARFVAAQQMRTPLFFIEWVKRFNESMPETLRSILDEVGRKSPAELGAAEREPDIANYLREKLRVTVDPVPDSGGVALVQAEVSSSRTAWLRFMRRMLTKRTELFYKHRWRVMKLAGDAGWR
jgi:hypothetical protein